MNRFRLALTALLTATLVVTSLPLQAFAQDFPPFNTVSSLRISGNGDQNPITVDRQLFESSIKDMANWTNYDKSGPRSYLASIEKAFVSGDYAFLQIKTTRDSHIVKFVWSESKVEGLQLQIGIGGQSYILNRQGSGPKIYFIDGYLYNGRLTFSGFDHVSKSTLSTFVLSSPLGSAYGYFSVLMSTFAYTKADNLKNSNITVPAIAGAASKTISPNFTLEVKNRTIQVQHIKEFDRIPGYENDKPVIEAFLKKCNKVVTHKDFNPNALNHEALENVFGFVKLATDPLVDVGNAVVTKIAPGSPKLGKIPERERDRILWCSEPEIVKSDYVDPGSLLRYEITDYGYYLVSLKYLTEHRHSYNSAITPDYVYYQTPDSNDKYNYDPREVVFNADGKTFSNDTRNLNCDTSGFCEVPPDEKDCSYSAQGSWSKVVACHIGNFMTGFGNFMKWLFIPDSLSVYNSFNTMLDNLKKSFGFIALPITMIPNVWSLVNHGAALGPNCATPPLTIFGASASFQFCAWRQHFPQAWSFMQTIIQGAVALAFIWVLYGLFMRAFGIYVKEHSPDDDAGVQEVRWLDERTGDVGDWERRRK